MKWSVIEKSYQRVNSDDFKRGVYAAFLQIEEFTKPPVKFEPILDDPDLPREDLTTY